MATTPEALSPQWLPLAAYPASGAEGPALGYFAGRILSPRMELWALRIDLRDPALELVLNEPEPGAPGGEGHIPSVTVSGFVKTYRCLAGINTNPFSPVSGKTGEDRRIDGIALSRGRLIAPPSPVFDALVLYKTGEAAILNQGDLTGETLLSIRTAVGGFYRVLTGGRLPEAVLRGATTRHPRSAAGLSPDGRYLYLLAVDGRRPGSAGASLAELGRILARLGASEGINFDGGGSTALALRYPDGRVRTVNTPIHNRFPGWERGVAICLGVREAALSETSPPAP
jgi:hypothetical protein